MRAWFCTKFFAHWVPKVICLLLLAEWVQLSAQKLQLIDGPAARTALDNQLKSTRGAEDRAYVYFNIALEEFFVLNLDKADSLRKLGSALSLENPSLRLLNRGLLRFRQAVDMPDQEMALNLLLRHMMGLVDSFDRLNPGYDANQLNLGIRANVRLLYKMRDFFDYVGQTQQRYEFYQRKLQDYVKSGNLPAVGVCYHSLGGYYYARGEFDKAMYMYWRALEVFEPIAPAMYADAVNAIAQLYYDMGNPDRSLEFAKRGQELYAKYKGNIPEDTRYVSALLFVRVALDRQDTLTAARLMQQEYNDYPPEYLVQRILQEVELSLMLNQTRKADMLVQQAVLLEKQYSIPFYSGAGVIETDYWLARVKLAMGDGEAALAAYFKALAKARERKYLPKVMLYYRSIASLYAGRGQYERAVEMLDNYVVLRDSIDFVSYRNQVANGELAVRQESLTDRLNGLNTEKLLQDTRLRQTRVLLWIAAIGSLLFLMLAFVIYRQLQLNKSRSRELAFQKSLLEEEMKKSDQLLLNILPGDIAEELKETGQAVARSFDNVTVLFTDFVGFTSISSQLSPAELVEEIHRHFTRFDAITEQYGLEKIKTIGDAYLAVCGLPEKCDDHAERVVLAALAIRDYIGQQPSRFGIRIGVHSGPVVAGIVGVKKYAYDIWGDTVNTAARMEQKSEPGKINITGQTLERIQHRFDCTYRGKLEAKNKGQIDMYFVNGEKSVPGAPIAS